MIKIIATTSDAGMAVHMGSTVESISGIIEVPTKNIPPNLKQYLAARINAEAENRPLCQTVTFSLLVDDI